MTLGGRGSLASPVTVSRAGSGRVSVSVPPSIDCGCAVIDAARRRAGVAAGASSSSDAADAGDLRQAELLGDLRADLGGVAVDRLAAAEHEVGGAELLDRAGERVARGQRVGAGERPVGEQDDLVGAAVQRLAQHLGRGRRAHGEHGHAAAVAVLEAQRLFEGVQVFGVEDRRQRRPVDGAVVFHGLAGHVGGVRDLLDQDDDAQLVLGHCSLKRYREDGDGTVSKKRGAAKKWGV